MPESMGQMPPNHDPSAIERLGFHAHDGWFFQRAGDGDVVITQHREEAPLEGYRVVLDPETWASIVAYVSADGEGSATHARAKGLHGGNQSPRAIPMQEFLDFLGVGDEKVIRKIEFSPDGLMYTRLVLDEDGKVQVDPERYREPLETTEFVKWGEVPPWM